MKQVTIDTVKARISKLQSRGNAEYSLGLTLNEEFELACLRQLVAGMEQKPYGYAELYDFPRTTATLYPEQDRYATMPLYAAPPAPVSVPDAATAIRACIDEFPESVRDIVEECASIAENAYRAAMLHGAEKSPATDNTAQQFESLAYSKAHDCLWSYDSQEYSWNGKCGTSWTFFDDGPEENGMKFCPGCGKPVSTTSAGAAIHEPGN